MMNIENGAEAKPRHDAVYHPEHYTQGGIECIDAIQSAIHGLPASYAWATGQIIKYLWRWYRKNGIQDLQKAQFYLDWLITRVNQDTLSRPDSPEEYVCRNDY